MEILDEETFREENFVIHIRQVQTEQEENLLMATVFINDKSPRFVFQPVGDERCQFIHKRSDALPPVEVLDALDEFGVSVQNIPPQEADEINTYDDLLDAIQRYMVLITEECEKQDHALSLKGSAKYSIEQVINHREYIKISQNPNNQSIDESDRFGDIDTYPRGPRNLLESLNDLR